MSAKDSIAAANLPIIWVLGNQFFQNAIRVDQLLKFWKLKVLMKISASPQPE